MLDDVSHLTLLPAPGHWRRLRRTSAFLVFIVFYVKCWQSSNDMFISILAHGTILNAQWCIWVVTEFVILHGVDALGYV